jgi:hypothetical protein
MDDDVKDALIQKLLIDSDIFNPPTDINKINLLEDTCKEIQDFKNTVNISIISKILFLFGYQDSNKSYCKNSLIYHI